MRRIGVLTSGGDGPGLNPCIRAVTRTALGYGMEVIGIKRGYAGLMDCEMIPLDARAVGGIIGKGGTFLGTDRTIATAGQHTDASHSAPPVLISDLQLPTSSL